MIPALFVSSGFVLPSDYSISRDPQSYILGKFQLHDLVLLGTRHKRDPILQFISDLIPALYDAGVTHIGLEICSDQQGKIDQFIETGRGLINIAIHPQIDYPGYRDLLQQIRGLDENKRPGVIAIDLPKSRYEQMNRDEYMAESIAKVFRHRPAAKVFVVLGNNHILKKLDWQDHVLDKNRSIRTYLNELAPGLPIFSIGQLIDENPGECDFTRRFAYMNGSVAMDCDNSFREWKIGITSVMAIKPTEPCELVDGVIVY